jgi:glyoxalase-like protein
MSLRFDHAVVLVNDLNTAINDYRALGFNPFFGGEHVGGKTHNALIVFQDSSYLELLAPTSPELLKSVDPDDRSSFLYMFQYGEGFGGYALLSQDLAADTKAMQQRRLDVQLRPPGGRARPDGQQLRWQSAMIGGSMTPFFIQDETPRVLRVPNDAAATQQPNGVSGVAALRVAVSDLEAGTRRYEAILGTKPKAERTKFDLGDFTIHLVQDSLAVDRIMTLIVRGSAGQTLDRARTQMAHVEVVE